MLRFTIEFWREHSGPINPLQHHVEWVFQCNTTGQWSTFSINSDISEVTVALAFFVVFMGVKKLWFLHTIVDTWSKAALD